MLFRNVELMARPANHVRYVELMSKGNQMPRRKTFFFKGKAILRY